MSERIRFLTDEHIASAVVLGLRQRGVKIASTADVSMLGTSDEALLQFAKNEGMVIVTQDTDFLRLHARGVEHGGIVYVQQLAAIGPMISGLMLIYEILSLTELQNHVEFLN